MARPHIAKSEQRGDWETPKGLFDWCDKTFGPFDMDAAAAEHQYTAQVILGRGGRICIETPEGAEKGSMSPSKSHILYDAFEHPWHGRVFLNPPYGPPQLLYAFIEKTVREIKFQNVELVCALLPSRTGTRWWQDYVVDRATRHPLLGHLEFLRGRLKFGQAEDVAPFASVVVVWRSP